MNVLKEAIQGHVGEALGKVEQEVEDFFGALPAPLSSLVSRLMSDEGKVALQVAQDAFASWQDGTSLLDVAKAAAAEAATKGLSVAETDIADWLGLLDRSTPNAAPIASTASAAS